MRFCDQGLGYECYILGMKLVIVSGAEATGKTAIGHEIASRLGLKYQSKDNIKEALFDSESHNTWDHFWYEKKAKNQFFEEIKQFVTQNKSAVIESNFNTRDKQCLANCLNSDVEISEIYCTTKGLTSFRRFVRRNEAGLRHKGHHDRRWYAKILLEDLLNLLNIRWPSKPFNFNKKLLVVDTTNFKNIDYKKIINFIEQP